MFITQIKYMNLRKIAESGQCFRMHMTDDTHAELVAYNRYLQIAELEDNNYAFSCSEKEFKTIWAEYFDLSGDYEGTIRKIRPDDAFLTEAAQYSYGIRILKQEHFETLISYIISQRKSIPSIMTSVERIAEQYGNIITIDNEVFENHIFAKPLKKKYYSFPNPQELDKADITALRRLGVGYRAEYIYDAVKRINTNMLNLTELEKCDDSSLYERLLDIHGVGKKVANCVMLYSYARTKRFPIDVWIQRILDKYYDGSFDENIYGDSNGILQQLMFYFERTKGI
ncbi:MAG: DNA-3-methyladenine glycosylase 2 family protein [Clostridia bacterium]|nr:DNA-3-methyladenine glycosylase 2 family protein [Clostridia bacterium]